MIQSRQRHIALFTIIFLLSIFILSILSNNFVGAIAYNGPDPAEFDVDGANARYILNKYWGGPGDQSDIKIPVYNTKKGRNDCPTTMDLDVYNIVRGAKSNQWIESNASSARFYNNTTLKITNWKWSEDTGLCRALVSFQLRNGDNERAPDSFYNNAIEFRLKTPNNGNWLIGNSAGETGGRFNTRAANSSPGQKKWYDYKLQLATPCSIKKNTWAEIKLFDLDNQHPHNENGTVTVRVNDLNTGDRADIRTSGSMGNNSTYRINMRYDPSHRYILHIKGISPINVVRYTLPYDNVNYNITCPEWNISPESQVTKIVDNNGNIVGSVDSSGAIQGDISHAKIDYKITWTHTITNDGPGSTDTNIKYDYIDMPDFPPKNGEDQIVSGILDKDNIRSFTSPEYTIKPTDVRYKLCRATRVWPYAWDKKVESSYDDRNGIISSSACVSISGGRYTLTPLVSIGQDAIESGSSFTVGLSVDNSGPDDSEPVNWKFEKTIKPPGGSTIPTTIAENIIGTNMISFKVGSPSPTMITPIIGYPNYPGTTANETLVGTEICYILSVQPHSTDISVPDGDQWASGRDCVKIGKKPKVQIHGGDLFVGGLVKTTTSVKNKLAFGSWSEYGIIANGKITGAGSGAAFANSGLSAPLGLVDDNTFCNASKLSFSNTPNGATGCNGTGIGNYKNIHTSPNVATTYPVDVNDPTRKFDNGASIDLSGLQGIYTANGSVNITGGSSKIEKRWVVINAPGADVTITGNITYTDATISSIKDIPQVIIIAKNITINEDVDNVDAWLVAKTNDTSSIYTCNYEAKKIDQCNKRLLVNGPVMTNHLYLRRTAGSENCNGSDCTPTGYPAEIFNLRADTYLWSMNQATTSGRIQTVYTSELPPRL